MNRRRVLQTLGIGAVQAPLLAKKAAEDAAAGLARVGSVGNSIDGCAPQAFGAETHKKFKQAVNLGFRKQIEAILYEEEKHVHYIDYDIAVMKSVSLSAKIVYQRKRNVERRIRFMELGTYSWDRLDNMLDNMLKLTI